MPERQWWLQRGGTGGAETPPQIMSKPPSAPAIVLPISDIDSTTGIPQIFILATLTKISRSPQC